MADNYLEKKMEEYRSRSVAPKHPSAISLNRLLLLNRSHRGYDQRRAVTIEELRRIVGVNTRIPSARNQQCLRFRMVTAEEAHKVLPHIKLGSALPELHLPIEGTEPQAFIIVCSTIEENKWVDMDLGISAQSMLLKATEMGLNGICIGAFNAQTITEAFSLPYTPILILAIGKGAEQIQLTEISTEESHTYYRKEGIHYVPKVKLDDLLINKLKDEN
jgi:nitroreductase